MADSLAELEDALGISAMASPTPLPTVTPTATPSPLPELSWWDTIKQYATQSYTPQLARINGLTQEEYAKQWTLPGIVESLRVVPEEGASIGGSIVGSALGAALGRSPFAARTGATIGGALGSYADVPIQSVLDYLTGTVPEESRTEQATKEAVLGAGIETALRGAGALGRVVAPTARKITGAFESFLGPQTEEVAQRLVGKELANSIGQEELARAVVEKQALGQAGEALTTADVTGSKQLARMQTLLAGQPASNANVAFAETATKQLELLDEAATSLTNLKDPNPKLAGEASRKLLEQARDAQNASASAKFTDELRQIPAPTKGLNKSAQEVVDSIYKESDVLGPSGQLEGLVNKIKELDVKPTRAKTPAGFGRQAAETTPASTQTTVGTLQDLRSQALELSRSAAEGSRDELLADRLSNMLAKRIDDIEGTEGLKEAQRAWRSYKQRWFRAEDGQLSPLAKLLRKQNPEDIITSVSKKSAVSDEYAKVLGSLEPIKLATEMGDFVQQKTVKAKLDWLRAKRPIYVDSPIAPILQQWEDSLTRIQKTTEAGKVKNLSAENIDTQATSLIRALGGTGRQAVASAAEANTSSALRNISRSALTSALGGTLSGAAASVGGVLAKGAIEQSTSLTARALTEALSDPATALKFVEDASKYGKTRAAEIALTDKKFEQAANLLEALAPRAGAFARSAGVIENPAMATAVAAPAVQPTPAPAQADVTTTDSLAELEDALSLYSPNAEPPQPPATPTPTIRIGKQDVSLPVGDKYAPEDLMRAVVQTESGGKANAVSNKGARGPAQLMPGTAKELGVDIDDPTQNIEGGSRYLKRLLNQFNDRKLALAAYNWGPGSVRRALDRLEKRKIKPTYENMLRYASVPDETQSYVSKVLNQLT